MLSASRERGGRSAEADSSCTQHISVPPPSPSHDRAISARFGWLGSLEGGSCDGGGRHPQEALPYSPSNLTQAWLSARDSAPSCPSDRRMLPDCHPMTGRARTPDIRSLLAEGLHQSPALRGPGRAVETSLSLPTLSFNTLCCSGIYFILTLQFKCFPEKSFGDVEITLTEGVSFWSSRCH